jgi:hypothetical protein
MGSWDRHYDPVVGFTASMRFHQWRLTEVELHREFELQGFEMLSIRPIHQRSGLHWMVREDLHLPHGCLAHKVAYSILKPFLPIRYAAHMLLGVGRKR